MPDEGKASARRREFGKIAAWLLVIAGFFTLLPINVGRPNFLGHELTRETQKTRSLQQIAVLTPKKVREISLQYLKSIANQRNRNRQQKSLERSKNNTKQPNQTHSFLNRRS